MIQQTRMTILGRAFVITLKKAHKLDTYGYIESTSKCPYFSKVLPTLYKFRTINKGYLWKSNGEFEKGRQLRVEALKKAIFELETILNLQTGV